MSTIFEKIPDWFRGTRVGQQLLAETQQQTEARRGELIKQRQQLLDDRAARLPAQQKTLDEATAKRERAEKAVEAAKEVVATAYHAVQNDDHATQMATGRIDADLLKTAPACLAAFAHEIVGEMERVRWSFQASRQPTGKFNLLSGEEEFQGFSTRASGNARSAVLGADLQWAREMAPIECASESDAQKEIEARRSRWPELKIEAVA